MDRLSSRNYFVVVVAGMFCLLNTSVSLAAVGWFNFAPDVRARFIQQEANINQNSSNLAASFGTLTVSTFFSTSGIGTSIVGVTCPALSLVASANCSCSSVGGTRNVGMLLGCDLSGNGGAVGCLFEPSTFNPLLPPPQGRVEVACLSGLANDGTPLVPIVVFSLSNPGEQTSFISGASGNQKSFPSSVQMSGRADTELDAALISMQNQILDQRTALEARQP